MNWNRGLLRAWLLVTGLWLALNVVFHRPDVEVQTYWKLREVAAVGAQPSAPKDATVDTTRTPQPQRPASITEQLLSGRTSRQIDELRKLLETPQPPHLDETQRLAQAKNNLKIFALTAFLPPAILFVIGAGGLWVFSGFRRADT